MNRLFTVLRLLAHWSTGAVVGSVMTTNRWTTWATVFVVFHVCVQLIGLRVKKHVYPQV